MTQSKAEIKAIQAKLQAIQSGRSAVRSPDSPPLMVELTPNSVPQQGSATATIAQPKSPDPTLDPTKMAATLQQRSAAYLQQMQPSRPQPSTAEPQVREPQLRIDAVGRLEAQVQRINALSAAQEAAMLELKAIAERLERDWRATEIGREPVTGYEDAPVLCQYLNTTVPCIEKGENGSYVLTTRDVDLFRAEREAALNARGLRQRVSNPVQEPNRSRRYSTQRSLTGLQQEIKSLSRILWKSLGATARSLGASKPHAPSLRTARSQPSQTAELPDFSMQDAILWVLGAVVVRVGLDLLLISNPGLWLPVVGLIVTPAAIAVYRATVAPQSGFIWGYRLLLIMIGLLLGGRLY